MKSSLITIVFIFICLFAYTKLFGPIPFSVNSVTTTKTDLFRADGVGKASAIPNTALISMGVTNTASTVLDAQDQTNTLVNNIIADLKKLDISEKNIQTTSYSVRPEYDYKEGTQTIRGYTVTQSLEVKISPIETANKAVDTAVANGANLVGGITFILDDKTKMQVEEKARKEAIENAKQKAQSLAGLAGMKLGRIVDVQESPREFPRIGFETQSLQLKDQAPTQLTPGENTIEVTIVLSYETL